MGNKINCLPSILQKKEKAAEILKNLFQLKAELSQFKNVDQENVAMCFLVDATGSMASYVAAIKAQIHGICSKIKENMKQDQHISISMVAYRDRKDIKPIEKMEFTENINTFIQFADTLTFTGGDDACEDVKAGFKEALTLNWQPQDLNLLIWIADSPCHGKKYHSSNLSDHYPEDNEEIEGYLQRFSEKNIDIYFYKITDATNQMIKIFKEKYFISDKFLRESRFQSNNLTQRIVSNHQNSKSLQIFSQFFRYTKQFEKTTQLERCKKLKQINKNYISLQISQNSESILSEKKFQDIIQASDIQNGEDIQWNERQQFEIYQLQFDSSKPDKIEVYKQPNKDLVLTKDIIAQGSFKECFLGQDCKKGTFYAMKRFKEQTTLDLDYLIFENVIHLVAIEIRDRFIEQLKKNTCQEDKLKENNLNLYFDDLWIARDTQKKQIYLMEVAKYGFVKFINNDSNTLNTQNDIQSELFQSFIHYSFEVSGYSFILSDIQGFGNILNDISIHSQNLIDKFENISESQLQEQFLKGSISLEKLKINTQINSNLGDLGIVLFLNSHKCNKYCKRLKLKSIDHIQKDLDYNNKEKEFSSTQQQSLFYFKESQNLCESAHSLLTDYQNTCS